MTDFICVIHHMIIYLPFCLSKDLFRSSRADVFYKKAVLRNFTKFTGKHLCQSLFFNKVARPATLFKKRLRHRCFPVNFVKFLRTPFFTEHLWWLLLFVKRHIYSVHIFCDNRQVLPRMEFDEIIVIISLISVISCKRKVLRQCLERYAEKLL